MTFRLQELQKSDLVQLIDTILKGADTAKVTLLDDELGDLIAIESDNPRFELYYRWALAAERIGNYEIAFDRWLCSHKLWPVNEWFLNRCFEVGILTDRWMELLQLVPTLMPHLVRRGGRLPNSWSLAITRLCFNCLTSPLEEVDIQHRLLREVVRVQAFIESVRKPKDLTFHCIAADILDLQPKDPDSFARACTRITSLIRPKELVEMPASSVMLFLMSCGDSARPDLKDILQENIQRLGLIHLEMIFGIPANLKMLGQMSDILQTCLPGLILTEMLRAIQCEKTDPADLIKRIRKTLTNKYDTSYLGHEVRFLERWLNDLSTINEPIFVAPNFILKSTKPLAVCIYGQMRGFHRVKENWKSFFEGVECDIYVSTWRKCGRRELIAGPAFSDRLLPKPLAEAFDIMCLKYGTHEVRKRYPSLLKLLSASDIVTVEDLRSTYSALVSARIDDDDESCYKALAPQEKMHLRGRSAFELCVASGRQYDRILRIRPDLPIVEGSIQSLMSDEALMRADDNIVWSDGKQRLDHRYGFIMGDRVTFGTPKAIDRFTSIWNELHLARPGTAGMEDGIYAHRTLAFFMLRSGMRVARLPIQFGLMLDPEIQPVHDLREAIIADAGSRMDEVDICFLSALDQCPSE